MPINLCVSSDALSAKARRMYEKSASQIIDEYLLIEAKAYLQNPAHSIQNVAELLLSLTRLLSVNSSKDAVAYLPVNLKKENNKKPLSMFDTLIAEDL